jgi:rubrerythrin
MSISFNADEVFEMAEEIERNGAKFYRKAASNAADPAVAKMLNDMAVMEDGHLAAFAIMRTQLSGSQAEQITFDPDGEAAMYLQSMADFHGFEGKVSIDEELTGNETPEQILNIAITAEKESVAFYAGIRDLVSEKAGKDKVDDVIREEMQHVVMLTKCLMELKS